MTLFLNLRYQWIIPDVDGIGVCMNAQGVPAPSALTRDSRKRLPPAQHRIFDPQLYLRRLDYETAGNSVKRLSTYPWFNPSVPDHDTGQGIREWMDGATEDLSEVWPPTLPDDNDDELRKLIQRCLDMQMEFGVGRLILPVPATLDPTSDFSREAIWMDRGMESVPVNNELPVYVTLAISDQCLMRSDPPENELLETIVDQLAARPALDGVYVVLEQSIPSESLYITNQRVAWSLLSLCYDIGVRAQKSVIVNFADVFGYACIAAGAESFCAGPNTKGRRLCLTDFDERHGGGAFPRFYAHSLILDLAPQRDIENKILDARLLRMIEADETSFSSTLFAALKEGTDVEVVGDWQESLNNTTASAAHRIELINRAVTELKKADNKINVTLAWLQDAERNAAYLAERFDTDILTADFRHVAVWRAAFEQFLDQYGF